MLHVYAAAPSAGPAGLASPLHLLLTLAVAAADWLSLLALRRGPFMPNYVEATGLRWHQLLTGMINKEVSWPAAACYRGHRSVAAPAACILRSCGPALLPAAPRWQLWACVPPPPAWPAAGVECHAVPAALRPCRCRCLQTKLVGGTISCAGIKINPDHPTLFIPHVHVSLGVPGLPGRRACVAWQCSKGMDVEGMHCMRVCLGP